MTSSTLPEPDPDRRRTQSIAPPSPDANYRVPVTTEPSADVVAEFTTFYKTALPQLVAFLRWQGAPLPEAADCAQEALAACFQQWTTIEQPYAWCRTTASRRYARYLATIREHPVDDLNTVGYPLLTPAIDIDALEHRHPPRSLPAAPKPVSPCLQAN